MASPFRVVLDLDDGITRDLAAPELLLGITGAPFSVFSFTGVLQANSAVAGPLFTGSITHSEFGGHGLDTLSVLLNGFPLEPSLPMEIRSPDINGDGLVDIIDFSIFGPGYPSPPNPYYPEFDFDGGGEVDLIDMSVFGAHYGHQTTNPAIPSPREVTPTQFQVSLDATEVVTGAITREMHVALSLQNISAFSVAIVMLANDHEHLDFSEWRANDGFAGETVVVPVERNGVKELVVGVRAPKSFSGSRVVLGTAVFDISGSEAVALTEADFELRVGDILMNGGSMGSFAGISVDRRSTPTVLRTELGQNYPNPFNPQTTIAYSLAKPEHVKLNIYSVDGRLVRTLSDEQQTPNRYRVVWDGRNRQGSTVASGVYFYRLQAGGYTATRKMVLLR